MESKVAPGKTFSMDLQIKFVKPIEDVKSIPRRGRPGRRFDTLEKEEFIENTSNFIKNGYNLISY